MSGRIVKVSGPLVVAEGMEDANMADVVRVGAVEQQAEHARREGGVFENSQDSFHTISPFTIVAQTAPVSVSPSKGERLLCV